MLLASELMSDALCIGTFHLCGRGGAAGGGGAGKRVGGGRQRTGGPLNNGGGGGGGGGEHEGQIGGGLVKKVTFINATMTDAIKAAANPNCGLTFYNGHFLHGAIHRSLKCLLEQAIWRTNMHRVGIS